MNLFAFATESVHITIISEDVVVNFFLVPNCEMGIEKKVVVFLYAR